MADNSVLLDELPPEQQQAIRAALAQSSPTPETQPSQPEGQDPVDVFDAQQLTDFAVQSAGDFSPTAWATRNTERLQDPAILKKLADANANLEERGFEWEDLDLKKSVMGLWDMAKGMGKWGFRAFQVGGNPAVVRTIFPSKDPEKRKEFEAKQAKRSAELVAATESAMFGVAEMGKKIGEKTFRALPGTKTPKDWDENERVERLWDKVGLEKTKEQILHGQGALTQAGLESVIEDAKRQGAEVDPNVVGELAAGDPISFVAMAGGFGVVSSTTGKILARVTSRGQAVAMTTAFREAQKAAQRTAKESAEATGALRTATEKMGALTGTPLAEPVLKPLATQAVRAAGAAETAAATAEAVGRAVPIGTRVVGTVQEGLQKATGAVSQAATRATEAGIGTALGVVGVSAKTAEALGKTIASFIPPLATPKVLRRSYELSGEVGESSMKSAGQLFRGAVPEYSPALRLSRDLAIGSADVAKGAAKGFLTFDVPLAAATSEVPEDTAHMAVFGSMLGGLKGTGAAAGRVVAGQTIAPRKWADGNRPVRPYGNFSALDAATKSSLDIANDPAKVQWLAAFREFLKPTEAETHWAADPKVFEDVLRRYVPNASEAWINEAKNQRAVTLTLRDDAGVSRKVAILKDLEAAPHEAFHPFQDVVGERGMQVIDQIIYNEFAPIWDRLGNNNAQRFFGPKNFYEQYVARGEGWQEALLDLHTDYKWRETLSSAEAEKVANTYLSRELSAEGFDALARHSGPNLAEGKSLPEKLGRVMGKIMVGLGVEPYQGVRTEGQGVPLTFEGTESLRRGVIQAKEGLRVQQAGIDVSQIPPYGTPPAGGKGPTAPARPTGPTGAEVTVDNIATVPDAPAVTGRRTLRALLGDVAQAIKDRAHVVLDYRHAPDDPASSPISNRETRRQVVEAHRAAPESARSLFASLFVPDRILRTKDGGFQVQGWSPEVFAANAQKLAKAIANVEGTSRTEQWNERMPRYPIDENTQSFTPEGWEALRQDAINFSQNQLAGLTGAGEPLVVPSFATERGFTSPAKTGEPGATLPQMDADVINALFGIPVPSSTRIVQARAPRNVIGQEVSEATQPGRVSPVVPKKVYEGPKAEAAGVEGREISEVNPFKQWLKESNVEVSFLEVIQKLNADRIAEVSEAPGGAGTPLRGVEFTLQAGFQPGKAAPGDVARDLKASFRQVPKTGATLEQRLASPGGWEFTFEPGSRLAGETISVPEGASRAAIFREYNSRLAERGLAPEADISLPETIAAFQPAKLGDTISAIREADADTLRALAREGQGQFGGGVTGWAYEVGSKLTDPAQLTQLAEARAEHSARAQAALKAKDVDTAILEQTKAQFFREASEFATGEGSAGTHQQQALPDFVPPLRIEAKTEAAFQPAKSDTGTAQTQAGREMESRGWRFSKVTDPKSGRTAISLRNREDATQDGGDIAYYADGKGGAYVDTVNVPQRYQEKGHATTLYREMLTDLQSKGIGKIKGSVVAPQPLRIRQNLLGDPSYAEKPDSYGTRYVEHQIPVDARFAPRTEKGRELTKKGFDISLPEFSEGGRIEITRDGESVGWMDIERQNFETGDVADVSVRPEFRKSGIAEVLYREAFAGMKESGVKEVTGWILHPAPIKIREKMLPGKNEFRTDEGRRKISIDEALKQADLLAKKGMMGSIEEGLPGINVYSQIPVDARFAPSKHKDAVRAAAIRIQPGGKIFEGVQHADAYEKALAAKALPERGETSKGAPFAEDGFVTNSGEFIFPQEAYERGVKLKQIPQKEYDALAAELGFDSMLAEPGLESTAFESTRRFQPAKEDASFRTSGLAFKKFFSDATTGRVGKSDVAFEPVLDVTGSKQDAFITEQVKHTGNFDEHIAKSIPTFKETQINVGNAIVEALPAGSLVLDIAASEGSLMKSISALSDGKIKTVSLDPNPDMAAFFRDKSKVEGATYVEEAFLRGFEDGGKKVPAFDPTERFDVVHESMGFQFISPDRAGQIGEAKRLLKPDGVLLTEQKVLTDNWKANEAKKDQDYKDRYFSKTELAEKDKIVGFQQAKNESNAVGMMDNMLKQADLEAVLRDNFEHVIQYWDSGNFKGYAASDSAAAVRKIVDGIGDLNSKFSTVETPRNVTETQFQPRTKVENQEIHRVLDSYLENLAAWKSYLKQDTLSDLERSEAKKAIADLRDPIQQFEKTLKVHPSQKTQFQPETRSLENAQFSPSKNEKAIKTAAVRTKDGKIFEGVVHPIAARRAFEAGYKETDIVEDGFTSNSGEFLSREAAFARAQSLGQLKRVPKKSILALGELEGYELARQRRFQPRFKDKQFEDEIAKIRTGESDGQTFTPDGKVYVMDKNAPVDVVSLASVNTTRDKLTPGDVRAVVEKYNEVLDLPGVAVGVFPFESGDKATTSVDINAMVPQKFRENTVKFAKDNDQNSIFDLAKSEVVPTGGEGQSRLTTGPQIKAALSELMEGRPVDVTQLSEGVKASFAPTLGEWEKQMARDRTRKPTVTPKTEKAGGKWAFRTSDRDVGFARAWILPNGEPVQLGGQLHHEWLGQNKAELQKRWGLDITKDEAEGADLGRDAALKKGFARISWGRSNGALTVELRAADLKKLKNSIYDLVDNNAGKIDGITVNLMDAAVRKVVDSESVPTFRMENKEKADNIPFVSGSESRYQFQPAREESLPGFEGEKSMSPRVRSQMTQQELRQHFPEAVVPRSPKDSVPSEITESPLFKKAGSEEKAVDAFAKRLVEFAKQYKDDPAFQSGARWYSEFTPMLKKEFGKDANLMAELLSATSPNTSVDVNYGYAIDALLSLRRGRFEKIISKFNEAHEKISDGSWESWYNRELNAGRVAAPPQNPTPASFMAHWIDKFGLKPTQSNGKLYGQHSEPVMQVFTRRWLAMNRGPKTENFVRNLLGTSDEATVDIWADRTMRWAGYEGFQERWRILSENKSSVSDTDFEFAQKAFRRAAEKLKMKPSALQGALWFAEKKRWADNGWGRLDLGDFRQEIKKTPLLKKGFERRLVVSKAESKIKPREQLGLDIVQPKK